MILNVLFLYLKYFIQFGLVHSLNNAKQSDGRDVNNNLCDSPTGQMYWPHPTNCHTYIECSPLGPLEMHCAPGTAWSQSLLICNQVANADCEISTPPTPPWDNAESDGSDVKNTLYNCDSPTGQMYWPHPTNCHTYIQCTPLGPLEMHCAPGTSWSQSLLICNPVANADYKINTPPTPPWDNADGDKQSLLEDSYNRIKAKPTIAMADIQIKGTEKSAVERLYSDTVPAHRRSEPRDYFILLPDVTNEMSGIQIDNTIKNSAEKFLLPEFFNEMPDIQLSNIIDNTAEKLPLTDFTNEISEILIDNTEKNPAGKSLLSNIQFDSTLNVFTDDIYEIVTDTAEKLSADTDPVKEKSEPPDYLTTLPDFTDEISEIPIDRPTKFPIEKVISSSNTVPAHVKLCVKISKYINDMLLGKDSTHKSPEILLDQNKITKTCVMIAKYLTDEFQEKALIWISPQNKSELLGPLTQNAIPMPSSRKQINPAEFISDHKVSESFTQNKPGSTSKLNDNNRLLDQLANVHERVSDLSSDNELLKIVSSAYMATSPPGTIGIINKDIGVQSPNLKKDSAAPSIPNVIEKETFALTSSYPAYEKEMMTTDSIYLKNDTEVQNLIDGGKDQPFFDVKNNDGFDETDSDISEKDLQILNAMFETEMTHNSETENIPDLINSEDNQPLSKMLGGEIYVNDIVGGEGQ